jgi:hypothetical protein
LLPKGNGRWRIRAVPKHQGIDDMFVGKASVTNYCYQGKWLTLQGASSVRARRAIVPGQHRGPRAHILGTVSDNELRLMDRGSDSELVIRLTPDLEFGYGDSRVVTGEEKQFEEAIVVFFGPVPDEGEPDSIAVAALKQD